MNVDTEVLNIIKPSLATFKGIIPRNAKLVQYEKKSISVIYLISRINLKPHDHLKRHKA